MPRTNTKQVIFNAPALQRADISTYPGLYKNAGDSFQLDSRGNVMSRKGWLTADTSFLSEWTVNPAEDADGTGSTNQAPQYGVAGVIDGVGPITDQAREAVRTAVNFVGSGFSANSLEDQSVAYGAAKKTVNLIPSNRQYGFRFMYNPPMIAHKLGVMRGINPSYTFASVGGSKSIPILGVGSVISLELTINRVDDVSTLRSFASDGALNAFLSGPDAYGSWNAEGQSVISRSIDDISLAAPNDVYFDVSQSNRVNLEQAKEIQQKGTIHDLEYLFRTMMGRMYKTSLRGETADVGIATGQLLVLYLSKDMVYRVKVSDFGYVHKLFTPDMTPTLTDVSITFERIPDGYDYSEVTA